MDHSFFPFRKKAFDFNYGAGIHYKPIPSKPVLSPESSPLTFYDRYLGSNLILKQTIYIPSLVHVLCKLCDDAMEKYLVNGGKFHPEATPKFGECACGERLLRPKCRPNVSQVRFQILLHPNCRTWASLFYMDEARGYESNAFLTDAWLRIRGKPQEGDLMLRKNVTKTELQLSLDHPTTEKIIDIGHRYPRLATWEMFP